MKTSPTNTLTKTPKPHKINTLGGISCSKEQDEHTNEDLNESIKRGDLANQEKKHEDKQEEKQKNHYDLERLLTRDDIWRGLSAPLPHKQSISSGYRALDEQLNGGWPLATLIDITNFNNTRVEINSKNSKTNNREAYAPHHKQGTNKDDTGINCLLFAPAIRDICQNTTYWALLNPPNQPYAPGLAQHNLPLDKLLVIKPDNKNDFIACFIELCRSKAFSVIMAWAPKVNLNYSELRKLHLASQKNRGLYLLFRSSYSIQQPSPAGLRLSTRLKNNTCQVNILKQKKSFIRKNIDIPLPLTYLSYVSHKLLGVDHVTSIPKKIKHTKNIHLLHK